MQQNDKCFIERGVWVGCWGYRRGEVSSVLDFQKTLFGQFVVYSNTDSLKGSSKITIRLQLKRLSKFYLVASQTALRDSFKIPIDQSLAHLMRTSYNM